MKIINMSSNNFVKRNDDIFIKYISSQAVVAHSFHPSTWMAEASDLSELKANPGQSGLLHI